MSTLDKDIDDLELDKMSPKEIERTVKALSPEGMSMRRERKDIRYKLYRLATEANGGPAGGLLSRAAAVTSIRICICKHIGRNICNYYCKYICNYIYLTNFPLYK